MRVAIIGTGGVGGFLGALLARAGHDVRFLARGAHLAAIRERGLELRSKQFGDFTVTAPASDEPAQIGPADLALLAVKMYDFEAGAQAVATALAPDGLALTIQNGLDAPYLLATQIGAGRVLAGTAAIEAAVLEPGVVGHLVPLHQLTVSELEGDPMPRLEELLAQLRAADVNASIQPSAFDALWTKAVMLIPFATATTAANCGLGALMASDEARALVRALSDEALAVAQASGARLSERVLSFERMAEAMTPKTPAFTSSMNRDFAAGKPLELEWLTAKLTRLADEHRVPAPAHKALEAVIRARQAARP